jgi:hypothetical protein
LREQSLVVAAATAEPGGAAPKAAVRAVELGLLAT